MKTENLDPLDEPKMQLCSYCLGDGCEFCEELGQVEVEDKRFYFNEIDADDER